MPGPIPDLFRPLTTPASLLYGLAVSYRNRNFDRGKGVNRLPVPVISVGNLTAGGTGKTPTVMYLVQLLQKQGKCPAIAMRGYKAGKGQIGDEEAEYRDRLPDVPVIADPDRFKAVTRHLQTNPDTDCIVLDDGFQHRYLARDLDIVLVDATRPFWQDRLLPAGMLREPIAALRRADAVIVTHSENLYEEEREEFTKEITKQHGQPPLAFAAHTWNKLVLHLGQNDLEQDKTWLINRPVMCISAIGNPAAFEEQVEQAGGRILAAQQLSDHHPYSPKLAARIIASARRMGAAGIITTGKDWVKLRRFAPPRGWPIPIAHPLLKMDFGDEEQAIIGLITNTLASYGD